MGVPFCCSNLLEYACVCTSVKGYLPPLLVSVLSTRVWAAQTPVGTTPEVAARLVGRTKGRPLLRVEPNREKILKRKITTHPAAKIQKTLTEKEVLVFLKIGIPFKRTSPRTLDHLSATPDYFKTETVWSLAENPQKPNNQNGVKR